MAQQHGNPELAENLRRAAELAAFPDAEVLAVYEALRPRRATHAELESIAARLEAAERGAAPPWCARPPRSTDGGACSSEHAHVTVVAGVDIGNSTTEVVLVEAEARLTPLAVRRLPTVGHKGSQESVEAAARLLLEVERSAGRRADAVATAELRPVDTLDVVVPLGAPAPSAVRRIDRALTPAGEGFAAGLHVRLSELRGKLAGEPVIVSVPAECGYEEAAGRLRAALDAGWPVAGILVASDDAVLIANRLGTRLPIVDEARVQGIAGGAWVALEVAPAGVTLERLSDPVAVARALKIPPEELGRVAEDVRGLADQRAAALVRAGATSAGDTDEPALLIEDASGSWSLSFADPDFADKARRVRPGGIRRLTLPHAGGTLSRAASRRALPRSAQSGGSAVRAARRVRLPGLVLAALSAEPVTAVHDRLATLLDRPVVTAGSEPRAAWLGARTTPGVGDQVTVCDLGGGTTDVIAPGGADVTAAGGGELLTAGVSILLGIARDQAEHVKRSASIRVHSAYLVEDEDGVRRFLAEPAPPEAVGHLCHVRRAPAPFDWNLRSELAPQEWRAARAFLKDRAIGHNVQRCLRVRAQQRHAAALGRRGARPRGGPHRQRRPARPRRSRRPGGRPGPLRADVCRRRRPRAPAARARGVGDRRSRASATARLSDCRQDRR